MSIHHYFYNHVKYQKGMDQCLVSHRYCYFFKEYLTIENLNTCWSVVKKVIPTLVLYRVKLLVPISRDIFERMLFDQ